MTEMDKIKLVKMIVDKFKDHENLRILLMGHIYAYNGTAFINDLMKLSGFTHDEIVALVTVIRSGVVSIRKYIGSGAFYPANYRGVIQFWDDAVSVVNGKSPLYIDVVFPDMCVCDHCGGTLYAHEILNCSTNQIERRYLPYTRWWSRTKSIYSQSRLLA